MFTQLFPLSVHSFFYVEKLETIGHSVVHRGSLKKLRDFICRVKNKWKTELIKKLVSKGNKEEKSFIKVRDQNC